LTELFALAHDGVRAVRHDLDEDAPAFGEGLQLVNILKDAPSDAREGRSYLPPGVDRAEVFALARTDLRTANEYVAILTRAGASPNVRTFCALPVRLAEATLDRLEQGVAKL